MKAKQLIFLIVAVILADQIMKFYIKLNFHIQDEHAVLGNWFKLHFVENEGMAWGMKFGGSVGKIVLTLFRLTAVIGGVFLLKDFIEKKYHKGFIACSGLIFAGALGNLLDSMFYGLIFESSDHFTVARLFPKEGGYAGFGFGKVVDMLYFPLFSTHFPDWIPFVGGSQFDFFEPVFNIADASISVGVITILIFQNRFFKTNNQAVTASD